MISFRCSCRRWIWQLRDRAAAFLSQQLTGSQSCATLARLPMELPIENSCSLAALAPWAGPVRGQSASLRSADRPRTMPAFSRSRPALGSLSLATAGRLRENPFLNCHTRYGRRCGAAYLAGGFASVLRTPASPWTPRYRFGTVKICSSGSVGRAAALPRKALRQLCTP